ncbi:MAG: ATP-binding cassette domain-containing protein [Planctomycetota bacterium]|nr:ATP-binding cassette domain-containing protein [Planctomycetota bacterium]
MNEAGLQLQNVWFQIGEFRLKGLSLEVADGEYFVLTGPNGAGKTVVIRLIAGLYRPASGDIRIKGWPVTDLPPWKRNVGYVPQDGVLFPNRTVRENVRFGLEVRRTPTSTVREQVGRVTRMLGIEHLLDRRVRGLSGGETQKTSLARALVLEPSILLLDEPVSAIDEDARDALCRELHAIQRQRGITILHVSHNRKETQLLADRAGVLRHGNLVDLMDVSEIGNEAF